MFALVIIKMNHFKIQNEQERKEKMAKQPDLEESNDT